MITLDQFREMKPGTIFYTAAPGGHGMVGANNLSEERFVKLLEHSDRPHIETECGGISYAYGRQGAAFYLDKGEAVQYMEKRNEERYRSVLKFKASQIEKLKAEIAVMEADGPGVPDYIYHERTENPHGSKL